MYQRALKITRELFGQHDPDGLIRKYGSPLYVYQENILRRSCRDMQSITDNPSFTANYSAKANTNIHLLRIIREEGLDADAMSPGEIVALEKAGFSSGQIFFVANNIAADEMLFAIKRKILVSVDSLEQLEMLGRVAPGSDVAVRLNPGIGAGHHEKVVTAGAQTKFGINEGQIRDVFLIAHRHNLKIVGINQHIGSLFMEPGPYLTAAASLLALAKSFPDLRLLDFGGGFGIPYRKLSGEKQLELDNLRRGMNRLLAEFTREYGREVKFKSEPGRYVVAECGVLLGTVQGCKYNGHKHYTGTDLGFNVLMRPMLYDSWHDILAFRDGRLLPDEPARKTTVVGNICESGDIIARDRQLPQLQSGDVLAVLDAGAYGYSMSSNYNHRLKPAEVLLGADGEDRLIRRRDTLEDLFLTTI